MRGALVLSLPTPAQPSAPIAGAVTAGTITALSVVKAYPSSPIMAGCELPHPPQLHGLITMCLSKAIVCFGAIILWMMGLPPVWCAQTLTHDDLVSHKELLQTKLDANKELLQKDLETRGQQIDALEKRLNDQVNRVSDVGSSVDRFGVIVAVLGTLTTVVLAAVGLIGYFSASARAIKEAQVASKKWFDDNSDKLKNEIEQLRAKASESHKVIDDQVKTFAQKCAAAEAQIAAQQLAMEKPSSPKISPISADNAALKDLAEDLKQKPEANYSFKDWNTRAFAAYLSNDFEDAAYFWGKAAAVPNIDAENVAKAAMNKGVTLGQLKLLSLLAKDLGTALGRFHILADFGPRECADAFGELDG